MEGILLDTMFDLPSLEGVEEVVISREVVEGTARPLYIYADRAERRRRERLSRRNAVQCTVDASRFGRGGASGGRICLNLQAYLTLRPAVST